METLPDDVLVVLFCFLSPPDMGVTSRVCKRFHEVIENRGWKQLFQNAFPAAAPPWLDALADGKVTAHHIKQLHWLEVCRRGTSIGIINDNSMPNSLCEACMVPMFPLLYKDNTSTKYEYRFFIETTQVAKVTANPTNFAISWQVHGALTWSETEWKSASFKDRVSVCKERRQHPKRLESQLFVDHWVVVIIDPKVQRLSLQAFAGAKEPVLEEDKPELSETVLFADTNRKLQVRSVFHRTARGVTVTAADDHLSSLLCSCPFQRMCCLFCFLYSYFVI